MRQEPPGEPVPDETSTHRAPAPVDAPEALPGTRGAGERALVTCRLCGRPLRGRRARLRGVGDGCLAKLRERTAPRPPERPVEQDALPGI